MERFDLQAQVLRQIHNTRIGGITTVQGLCTGTCSE